MIGQHNRGTAVTAVRAAVGRKEIIVTESTERRMTTILEQLQQDPTTTERLPSMDGAMVWAALDGDNVYAIAQEHEVTEGAVWEVLANAARAAAGHGVEPVTTGGFGSDTTPGLTGGYGATGFGAIGNEAPNPNLREPSFEEDESSEEETEEQ